MSTISQPDKKGVSKIHLGGEYVGKIKLESNGRYSGETFDGKSYAGDVTHPKNLAVKSLVTHYRNATFESVIDLGVIE